MSRWRTHDQEPHLSSIDARLPFHAARLQHDVAAEYGRDKGDGAGIRNVRQFDSSVVLDALHAEMRVGARARRTIGDYARIGLGVRNDVGPALESVFTVTPTGKAASCWIYVKFLKGSKATFCICGTRTMVLTAVASV